MLQDCYCLARTHLYIAYIQFLFEPNARNETRLRFYFFIYLFFNDLMSVYRLGLCEASKLERELKLFYKYHQYSQKWAQTVICFCL